MSGAQPASSRPEPSQRLITQNLLALASVYERQEQISWSTISHLSTLIDIAVLYNQIRIIGRQAYSVLNSGSSLVGALQNIISTDEFSTTEQKSAAINLAAFLNDRAGP